MHALATYKIEEGQAKNEWARVVKQYTARDSRAANPVVGDQVWPKIKLIQAFIVVLDTYNNDEDSSKNESTKLLTIFLPLKVHGDFFRRSRAANFINPGQILPNFEPI